MTSKQKSETAFLEEFVRARKDIQSYIYALVGLHALTEDIFQEVSIVLWQKFDSFKPGTDFCAWARSIVRYKVLNERRRKKEICWDPEVIEAIERPFEEEDDPFTDIKVALEHCLEKLSEANRILVQQKYGYGRSLQEIGKLASRSTQAVKVTLHRVRQKLSECIRGEMDAEAVR